MKILVLGGTGYLGKKIVSRLLNNNNEILCVCRRDSSYKNKLNSNKVRYVISDYLVLKELFKSENFDCIINSSCTYMNGTKIDDVVESNLIFPMRILSLAVEYYYAINSDSNYFSRVKQKKEFDKHLRFISIGTGLPDSFNLYTYTKKEFNRMGRFFSNEYGLEFINIELENYFGEDEPKNRFLPSVIEKLKKNQDIPLTQGEQLRDFIYVDDVMNAIELLVNKKDIPLYVDLPLGSGDAPSIKELVIYLKELLNSSSKLMFGAIPLRPNEPSSYADLAMYKLLGGRIRYNWKEGLKIMLKKEGLI